MSAVGEQLAAFELARGGIDALEVGGNLTTRPLIHDFTPHRISSIGHPVARGRQSTPYAMDAFAEDNLDRVGPFAEDDNVQGLPRRRYPNRNPLFVHVTQMDICRMDRSVNAT